jgi:hypothetical protein
MAVFALGGESRDRIEVEVLGYERAPVGDYHDDNWLKVRVSISAGAFSGQYHAAFLTDELVAFRDELDTLYRSMRGDAKFSTLEKQLTLHISGNGRGEIYVRGAAVDVAGSGNRLEFALELDQTHVQHTLNQLSVVISAFPVRAG